MICLRLNRLDFFGVKLNNDFKIIVRNFADILSKAFVERVPIQTDISSGITCDICFNHG
jgi:hypothetical protein